MEKNKYTSAPWRWIVYDYSIASLVNSDNDEDSIMSVSPCRGCAKAAKRDEENKIDWLWGRCGTPSFENAKLIETSPELLEALIDEVNGMDVPCVKSNGVRCVCKVCRRERSLNAIEKATR